MVSRKRSILTWHFALLTWHFIAPHASAQATLGGAFIVSRLPSTPSTAGTLNVPPNGLTAGVALFGGAHVRPRVVVQGELSIPARLTTVDVSLHPSSTFETTTDHRDTILSGLVGLRAASWCEIFVGGGLTFERTTATETIQDRFSGNVSQYVAGSSSATRATFTTGVDLPIRLHRNLYLLPTGRLHVIARDGEEPGIDVRPLSPPSKYVFRFGIGARVEF